MIDVDVGNIFYHVIHRHPLTVEEMLRKMFIYDMNTHYLNERVHERERGMQER